jgi:aconitate hydratase
MGILPLQFAPGESVDSLALTGNELFDFEGLSEAVASAFAGGRTLRVRARENGATRAFDVTIRIDTPQEVLYYLNGGILPYVLRQLLSGRQKPSALSGVPVPPEAAAPASSSSVDEAEKESFPASDPPAY